MRLAVGNGLRKDFWVEFQNRFNIAEIGEFYGATEGNASMGNPVGRVGACGFTSLLLGDLHPLRLVKYDIEKDEVIKDSNGFCIKCQPGEPGLLICGIRKASLHRIEGYENEKATKKKIMRNVFAKGDEFFNTGDVLVMDEEAFFYFCDRTGDTFRWKGENVSTFEVESTISKLLGNIDVVVYSASVPGCEGQAGMAAIVDSEGKVDMEDLYSHIRSHLPSYAIPLFVRKIPVAPVTGTSKFKKTELRKEGFDCNTVSDPLYLLHPDHQKYVAMTTEIYEDLMNRRLRL